MLVAPNNINNPKTENLNNKPSPFLIALVAPTASGKTALSLELAKICNAEIFSIDSLSIYKEIDIASAKPTPSELEAIKHYGINILNPNESCNAGIFLSLLNEAIQVSNKNILFIVGGSGFYLWAMMNGLSAMPNIDIAKHKEIHSKIASLNNPYAFLASIDNVAHISPNDTYRVHKLLEIYFVTNKPPSLYFSLHKPTPLPYHIRIYAINTPREILREKIRIRTSLMIKNGLIDEASNLLGRYGSNIQPFKAIGLKESLDFLSGKINAIELENLIYNHTCQLAKRQETFNKAKFKDSITLESTKLRDKILGDINKLIVS